MSFIKVNYLSLAAHLSLIVGELFDFFGFLSTRVVGFRVAELQQRSLFNLHGHMIGKRKSSLNIVIELPERHSSYGFENEFWVYRFGFFFRVFHFLLCTCAL